jgi:hypothetical protein
MFDKNYDPYAILEDLQNQFQRMAFHQQQMSAAIQSITATQIRQQQQIEKLGNMFNLLNGKADIIHSDLQAQIKAYIPPAPSSSQ